MFTALKPKVPPPDLDKPPHLCEIDHSINRIRKSPPQTGAFIESRVCTLKIYSLKPKYLSQRASFTSMMVPRKQVIKGAMAKGKAIEATEGAISPPTGNQLHATKDTCSSTRQEPIASI